MTSVYTPGETLTAALTNAELAFPTGSLMPYAGTTAPAQGVSSGALPWLLCDGTPYSRSTYATLYALIGTTYGSGDGSTTFNVPDMRGRVPLGQGSGVGGQTSVSSGLITGGSALTARTVGQWTGEEKHLLTASESGMPAYTPAGSVTVNNNSADILLETTGGTNEGYATITVQSGTGTSFNHISGGAANLRGGAHGHPATFGGTAFSGASAASSHNVLPPLLVVSYIIKS